MVFILKILLLNIEDQLLRKALVIIIRDLKKKKIHKKLTIIIHKIKCEKEKSNIYLGINVKMYASNNH